MTDASLEEPVQARQKDRQPLGPAPPWPSSWPVGVRSGPVGSGSQPTRYFSIASMSSDTPRPGSRGTS